MTKTQSNRENRVSDFPEQDIYKAIEHVISSNPYVKGYTNRGFSNFMEQIGLTLGKPAHKGIWIRNDKEEINIALSLSIYFSSDASVTLPEIGRQIQSEILGAVTLLTSKPINHVDLVIAEIAHR